MPTRIRFAVLCVVLCCGLSSWGSPPKDQEEREELQKILLSLTEDCRAESGCESLYVRIDVGSETYFEQHPEVANSEEESRMQPHRVGALLPQFLAAGVLTLVDEGKLSLEDPLLQHFPKLEMAKDIRVAQLLTHSSGLPDYSEFLPAGPVDSNAILEWLAEQEPEFEPNHCTEFSLTNVALAGALIEQVSEATVEDYLAKHVFRAADMKETHWCWNEPNVSEVASCWIQVPGESLESARLPRLFAATGLCSTPADMHAWQVALRTGAVLSEDSREFYSSATELDNGRKSQLVGAGCAVRLGSVEGTLGGGALGEFTTFLGHYPDFDLSILLLSVGGGDHMLGLERRIARAVMDLPAMEVRDLELTGSERERYLGDYYIGCSQVRISEMEVDGHLQISWPDGRVLELLYQGKHRFVAARDEELQLHFQVEGKQATGFLLIEDGAQSEAVRL